MLLLGLTLFACAGVESSVMDTAETLGKGNLSVSNTFTMGINATEWLLMDPEDIFDGDTVHPLQYAELKYGLNDEIDLSLRGGLHVDAQSAKLLLKKQLSKRDAISTAVVFGGAYSRIDPIYWDYWYNDEVKDFEVLSGDMSLLFTRRFWRVNQITLAARGSYHLLISNFKNDLREEEHIYNAGVRANWKHAIDPFYGMIEVGIEAPLSIEDTPQVYPWMGLRAGWDFDL